MNEMTEEDLKMLAAQLSHPKGDTGIEVGLRMADNNRGMIITTLDELLLSPGDKVLEIGHGNGWHLPDLFESYSDSHYVGLERSELMHNEAKSRYQSQSDRLNGTADFILNDSPILPFQDQSFQRIFSVNTLYFWEDPDRMLTEIARILMPGGSCLLSYADASCLAALPFTKYGFRSYERVELEELALRNGFHSAEFHHHSERIVSPEGESFERVYTIAVLEIPN